MPTNPFGPSSRYQPVAILQLTQSNGSTVAYVARRFAPQPETLAQINQHLVKQDDRLDVLSAQYLGDPGLFWRLADANRAMDPDVITSIPGSTIRISLPAGFPGISGITGA